MVQENPCCVKDFSGSLSILRACELLKLLVSVIIGNIKYI